MPSDVRRRLLTASGASSTAGRLTKLAFMRNYVLRAGFKEGAPGLVVSVLNSYYVFLKFAKLWELQSEPRGPEPGAP